MFAVFTTLSRISYIIKLDDCCYTTYEVACTIFGVEPLEYRREQLCINFAKKDVKRDATLFTKNTATVNTRTEKPRVR